MKRIVLPVLALLATVVTGCSAADTGEPSGGGAGGTASAKSTDPSAEAAEAAEAPVANPCDLLSEAEVSAALGERVTAEFIDHGQPTGIRQCLWSAVSETALENYEISLHRTEDMAQVWRDGGMTAAKMYEEQKALRETEPLEGIGDEAVLSGTQILALKGGLFINSGTLAGTSPKAHQALLELTTQAVNGL